MAGFLEQRFRIQPPLAWLDRIEALVARELAPSSRKIRTALRIATIVTIAVGLDASCHVNSQLGAVVVWLLAGAGPMMSLRRALAWQIAVMLAVIMSVVMARAFAETPWLMLPLVAASISFSTYLGATRKLGVGMVVIQVLCLITFYGVVFAPQQIGWNAAAAFDGSAIALGVIVLFDNWLWPDPGEPILLESLGASVVRARSQLLGAANFFLERREPRPPLPAPTSDLPAHMALLDQAMAEGADEHRRAILLAAITRSARISLEVDRLVTAARENLPREIRTMVRGEIEAAVYAVAAALDEISRKLSARIGAGADEQAPATRTHLRVAMENLAARVVEVRPAYIGKASSAEIENFAEFIDSLAVLSRHVERPLDEPPRPSTAAPSSHAAARPTTAPDPALVRYCLKVGLCTAVGYLVGLITQRADLFIILVTVITTATPTYGATLHKMYLRIIGAIIGGAASLLAIIVVSPNFDTLPVYMLATFAVFYAAAYASVGNARMSFAGKQMGIIFSLVFIGLSPSVNIYEPLWRIWGVLLGDFVVATVFFTLWPEYAGDSLLPRLKRVLANTLALTANTLAPTPGGSASNSEDQILKTNWETMRVLTEFLEIADDARMEGRTCAVYHNGVVEAAGTLRRIANRLSSIATARVLIQSPQLDPLTESAREGVFAAIGRQLKSWLDFFSGAECFNAVAARAMAQKHSADELAGPLNEFSSRLEEGGFARLAAWPLEPRRTMMAELQSMRRLEFLFSELNEYLADVPSPPREI